MNAPRNTDYADMDLKGSEDFRSACDALRRAMNAHASAVEVLARRALVKLARYEKKLAVQERARAKKAGKPWRETIMIRANTGRDKAVAKGLLKGAKLLRSAAKYSDKAWRVFYNKYGEDILGDGRAVFDHEPKVAAQRGSAGQGSADSGLPPVRPRNAA